MYQAEGAGTLLRSKGARGRRIGRVGVGRTVVLLGVTSFFTDVSSEMVAAILPLYLVYSVGLSPLQFGVVDGLNNGAAALVRLVGGGLGDRFRRHKEVAAVGYGLSAITRPAFLLVGSVFSAIGAIIMLDRIGKGIRTAPRDALISLSVPHEKLGAAFGVHRAMDTAGAMLGPLVAFGILLAAPDSFDAVFVVSFASALIGVAVIVLLVKPDRRHHDPGPRLTMADVRRLFHLPRFRALGIAGCFLALATVSDAFVYLLLQSSLGFDPRFFPLLFVGSAGAYMLLAVPAGRLADRVGRARVFVCGYVLLLATYGLLLFPLGGAGLTLALVLTLLGAYYAATDGVLAAAASATLPEHTRGTGLALISTFTSLGRLGGSLVFGAIWAFAGSEAAIAVFALALTTALVLAATVLRRSVEAPNV
jgi:MFS family permease